MSKATIKDVARAANVSITTVSLVLNNKATNISQETVNTVKRVCKELNYEPNFIASSLKSKTTKTIGLVVPEIDNGYYSRIVSCFDTMLDEQGYTLLTAISNNNFEHELELFGQMEARRVDYLIILPSTKSLLKKNRAAFEEGLEKLSIKYVIIDRKTNFNSHVEVVNDDSYGASLAVEYLVKQGHKRIACITGPEDVSSSDDRLSGYIETLKKHNLPIDQSLIYVGDYSYDTAKKISKEIIKRDDIDAIFAFNDTSAYAAYSVYNEQDKKIGRDVSLVGFDDNPFSSLISPSLTTVRQDIPMICKTALDELFNNEKSKKVIKIQPTLVERKSVCVK